MADSKMEEESKMETSLYKICRSLAEDVEEFEKAPLKELKEKINSSNINSRNPV